jgi:hypothetical protein
MQSTFHDVCVNTAARFVQTAVVIDDEAEYRSSLEKAGEVHAEGGASSRVSGLTQESSIDSEGAELFVDNDDAKDHWLDAREVVNGFVQYGVICSIQRPAEENEPQDLAIKTASNADILIIDWALNHDLGLAREIIDKVVAADLRVGGRHRLIIVYTAQSSADGILTDLEEQLERFDVESNSSEFLITSEHFRIVIFHKTRTKVPVAPVVPFSELARRSLREFSILTDGLLSCVAMNAVSAIREQTHGLLALFGKQLDGAFCAHRAMIPEPADSVDYAINLLSKEVGNILVGDKEARMIVEDIGLEKWFKSLVLSSGLPGGGQYSGDTDAILECLKKGAEGRTSLTKKMALSWIDNQQRLGNPITHINGSVLTSDAAKALVRRNDIKSINGCSPPKLDDFAEFFYSSKPVALAACHELSRICCTNTDSAGRNKIHSPVLKSGVVVKTSTKPEEYWLCIHPVCDSIRLKGQTDFLFIRLFDGSRNKADLILKLDDGAFKTFVLKKSGKTQFKTLVFDPQKKDRILGHRWHQQWRFKDVNGLRLRWIAEVQKEKALSIAHSVGSNASRVGFEQFEWLRSKGRG